MNYHSMNIAAPTNQQLADTLERGLDAYHIIDSPYMCNIVGDMDIDWELKIGVRKAISDRISPHGTLHDHLKGFVGPYLEMVKTLSFEFDEGRVHRLMPLRDLRVQWYKDWIVELRGVPNQIKGEE